MLPITMIVTVASFKGGVGKTVTAVHLSAYLNQLAPTVLVDGDPNRSATGWAQRGRLPFKVVDERQAVRFARDYEHIVIDTEARPDRQDLQTLAGGCDLLVIPTAPDALALDALLLLVDALEEMGADQYRVLLTMIPPRPSRDGEQARETLCAVKLPLFDGEVRRLVAFQKAALEGVPVYEAKDPRAVVGWQDYVQIGEEVLAGG
ncbi:MAG TPA: ParA family protein [Rubrobacteraceae bacterium]|jgi:chromosome partitioning protein|nr:ParA family protein [Rubrobacteraceae bacterium]